MGGHAAAGALLAKMQGYSALSGGVGALGGELTAKALTSALHPGMEGSALPEGQKQRISALSTLAAGLSGAVVGQGAGDALAGAQAGKNAVENNFLSPESMPKGLADLGSSVTSYAKYAQDNNLSPEQVQADLTRMVKGDLPEGADIVKAILSNTPVSDTVMAVLTAEEAKDYALALLSTVPAERALTVVGKTATAFTNKQIVRAAEKISTAKPGKQFTQPRDLNEQILWNQVKESPADGKKFSEMGFNLNSDPRFPQSSGFEKMTASHKLPNGSNIEIHYQHNSITGKAYDMKIVTPQRTTSNPSDVIESIKDNIR
ncbi:VENN motif pre-toxin domain-containing protein [Martelella alba]|uniref:VENN motif-containing domain-containing protein n=1 Tax=Martelella alba TaxID=2590451 RepID=A0ABY2SHJ4_9HYPH|nr:VENN motif pre-toxin domain-containing protein [Martelella alba]TKI04144.1 hypothetical protein FCN80_18865 [Martelella alba]